MNKKVVEWARKHIIASGKKAPPTHSPLWAMFFSGLITALSGLVPKASMGVIHMPILHTLFLRQKYAVGVLWLISILLMAWFLLAAWHFFCRGLQLSFPDAFEAFEHKEDEIG